MIGRTSVGLAAAGVALIALLACQTPETATAPAVDAPTSVETAQTAAAPRPAIAASTQTAVAARDGPRTGTATAGPRQRERPDQPLTAAELVDRVRHSVVHIATEAVAMDASGGILPGGGVGTGFIVDPDGLVVTNNHVISGVQRVVVTLFDGRTIEAEIVGLDPQSDLAVIRVPVAGLEAVRWGSSADLEVGEAVLAIGHALDLPGGPTVTAGVVSAKDRTITNIGAQRLTLSELIQTDASINPGNSGGPLLNMYGEVVGISTAAAGSGQGIGFAIAIDPARPLIETLIAEGRIERGFLGIGPATITRSIARQNGLPVDEGIYIVNVIPGSPAAVSGLRVNDILTAIQGEPVPDAGALSRVLAGHPPGETVTVTILRRGQTEPLEIDVPLTQRPER